MCQIQPTTCFSTAHELQIVSAYLNEKVNWGIIFGAVWKLYEIRISVSINKVFLEWGFTHWLLTTTAFAPRQQSWAGVTGAIWPPNQQIYYLPLSWQICYLLTPAVDSILNVGLSIEFSSLSFPQQEALSSSLLLRIFSGKSRGPVLQRPKQKGLPILSLALPCPSAPAFLVGTSHTALFRSQPASNVCETFIWVVPWGQYPTSWNITEK